MTTTTQFEVGKTYAQRFMSDWDSIAYFTIKARTAKTVTVDVHGKEVRRGLAVRNGAESFKPFGSYSMAMVVNATDTADRIKAEG